MIWVEVRLRMNAEGQKSPSFDLGQPNSEFLSVRETAGLLGVVRGKVYRMDRDHGPFRITKRGRRVLVDRRDFERYVASRTAATCSPAEVKTPDPPAGVQSDSNSAVAAPLVPTPKENLYRSGQRELVMPTRTLSVVFFAVLE